MSGDVERVAAVIHHEGWPIEPDWELTPDACGACAKSLRQAQVLLAPGGVVAGMVAEALSERDDLAPNRRVRTERRHRELVEGELEAAHIVSDMAEAEVVALRARLVRVEALADEWEAIAREQRPHLGCFDMHRHLAADLRAALADPDAAAPGAEPATGRQEAVNALMSAWLQRDSEFCVGATEEAESERELRDALRALGVADEEMGA
jgi:hypothetical protein